MIGKHNAQVMDIKLYILTLCFTFPRIS